MRYVVLGGLLVVAAGIYGLVWLASGSTNEAAPVARLRDATPVTAPAPTPAPVVADPTAGTLAAADELVAAGKLDAALDVIVKARRDHADQAALPFAAGKIYFAKMWWADGIKSFRDAIRLDPSYRADPELIRIAIRGFIMTPGYDEHLGAFLAELGAAAQPALDETARTHPNPQVRARAAAQLRRNNR
jgi:tetratricopeptide (TPR) repeat protein